MKSFTHQRDHTNATSAQRPLNQNPNYECMNQSITTYHTNAGIALRLLKPQEIAEIMNEGIVIKSPLNVMNVAVVFSPKANSLAIKNDTPRRSGFCVCNVENAFILWMNSKFTKSFTLRRSLSDAQYVPKDLPTTQICRVMQSVTTVRKPSIASNAENHSLGVFC